jgi:hypothetical protein
MENPAGPDPATESDGIAPEEAAPLTPDSNEATPLDPSPNDGTVAPSRRRLWVGVVAVAAVVVLVVVGLSFTGQLGSRYDPLAPAPATTNALSFSEAYGAANGSVGNEDGSWALVAALGVDVPVGGADPFGLVNPANDSCVPGGIPTVVDSAPGDVAKGISPYWTFTYESLTNDSALSVAVIDGTAQILGTTPPESHCLGAGRAGTLAPPGEIEDSPQAVQSLPNLTAFLGTFPSSTVLLSLSDEGGELGRVSGTAVWFVEASPCFGDGSSVALYSAVGDPGYVGEANATVTHIFADDSEAGFGSCEVPGTLGTSLGLNRSTDVSPTATGFGYVTGIGSVNGSLTASSFHPAVFPSIYDPAPAGQLSSDLVGFQVTSSTGAALANYSFASGSWTSGGSVTLEVGDSLQLETTIQTSGASLVLVANAPSTGELGIDLP